MGILDANQQTELEKPVTRVVYFVELQLSTGTQRISTFNQPITWGGNTWSGFGQLINISQVQEEEGSEAKNINITVVAAESSWLALAIGPVEEYRGRAIKLYMCPMDKSFTLVGTPVQVWRGTMDVVVISIDENGEGNVTIQCETSAFSLKRRPVFRINAAQQKQKYPTDTGFDYLVDLIAKPQLWLSKKFQAR